MKKILSYLGIFLVVFLFVAGSFVIGVYLGFDNRPAVSKITNVLNKESEDFDNVDFSPFWETWLLLDKKFVDPINGQASVVSNEERVYGAISGLVNSLGDPYTVFLPPKEKENFDLSISGNFSGVGMEVGMRDGVITVISPLPDSPAKKSGILAGDKVLEIDGVSTAGMNIDEAVNLIRGEKGTVVKLLVRHEKVGRTEEISIVRDNIAIPSVESEFLEEERVFVIRVFNFSAPVQKEFRDALVLFAEKRTDKLIIDLRGNPGGFLDASIGIASWFLPKGEIVLREVSGATEEEKLYRSLGNNVFNDKLKLAILIDGGSASASEILAGALSEHGIATMIGEKTFGKGSVQELVNIDDKTSLKVTIARWLTPKGRSISENGLDPDIEVPITLADIEAGRDPQLERAIEYLLSL